MQEEEAAPEAPDVLPDVPVLEPREGVPQPVETREALLAAAARLGAGTGPVAIDAERASGYRYSARAYLVQLRRAGSGTVLVDPVPLGGLHPLDDVLHDAEWVLHAASQDLPCLAGEGMRPVRLFDTELAGRLLGLPRVGLAAMVEELLGWRLEKGYSAADWSTRPLPEPWLRYAALDVEVLLELRDALEERLRAAGKWEWAQEEFDALTRFAPAPPPAEPWRRTSGLHRLRRPRQLAVLRELWTSRDELARERDSAPGRLLPDAALVELALASPHTLDDLLAVPAFKARPSQRRRARRWLDAVHRGQQVPDSELPAPASAPEGPPPARFWSEREPLAAARLATARAALGALAERLELPVENLVQPEAVRRLCWSPPDPVDEEAVRAQLLASSARPWQVELAAPLLVAALTSPPRAGAPTAS
ncbi:ribonuclease D [Motilibacter rhizosphaerae]|uniref:Ribonuclease D n=1 Tax=Motilibacter rhizosphaerae TaxID=598652 RepID=A0A4Q7NR30_9ACTN|nr:HRDC domain-containing protein [Motilibacter rhizosphaerae]RZS89516.1 ribonuclease D [Motilibacter rhizosphaerae]